jgi:molybdopterin/thiamine biosynthesis adenylyltransferase/rhodanese-related sulfurtransferase
MDVKMQESEFYSRQTVLNEIGTDGQEKLKDTKVLIIGAGGLGHPAATYLAAAGLGTIDILDFDHVEFSNLNRQVNFDPEQCGLPKAEMLSQNIKKQNPFIKGEAILTRLTVDNAKQILSDYDVLLDCTDNFPTKFLLHDFAWTLNKLLIQASLFQFEGQIQTFDYREKKSQGCLRCLWPKTPEQSCVSNCQEAGIVGAIAGTLGSMQALEVIKTILNLGTPLENTTLTLELLDLTIQKIKWVKDDDCPLCGTDASITQLSHDLYHHLEEFEVSSFALADYHCIDIRELDEIKKNPLPDLIQSEHWPYSNFKNWDYEINTEDNYLFICQSGIRSKVLVQNLGHENCFSFYNGVEGLR